MYHPGLGRWMTMDPIGFAGGDVNQYAAYSNSPLNKIDPQGLSDSGSNDGEAKLEDKIHDLLANSGSLGFGGYDYWICILSNNADPKKARI